jgi:hypothetical protein
MKKNAGDLKMSLEQGVGSGFGDQMTEGMEKAVE